MEVGGKLAEMCIEAASASRESVETWRRQRRTLERLPPHLAGALLHRLLHRRLLFPSLLEVFQHSVEDVDLRDEAAVDEEWMAYLGGFRYLRSLNLADCRGINNSALWPLSGMDSLKQLDLSRCSKVTNPGISHLLSISNLEILRISRTGVNADGVALLSSLRNLKVLDLGGIPVTDTALRSLQALTQLESLDIWGNEVSSAGAAVLRLFPRLSSVDLAWSKVTKLPNLPSITCLDMSNCSITSIFSGGCVGKARLSKLLLRGTSFDDVDRIFSNVETSCITFLDMSGTLNSNFHFLENMRSLEHLDLSYSGVTDDTIRFVADVGVNLRYLSLSNTKITSQGMSILVGSVAKLESLFLSRTAVDDVALSYIGMMPSLRVVDLSHTRIRGFYYSSGDAPNKILSLNVLRDIHHLETLNLEETELSDDSLQTLVTLRELQCVYLEGDLCDISLHATQSLPKLKSLGFRSALVSDSGLLTYRPPPALCLLDLTECWLLSPEAIFSFRVRHPGIEVRHEHVENHAVDHRAGFDFSSFPKTTQASQMRVRPKAVNRKGAKPAVVDERTKYSREELLEIQISPFSTLSPCDLPSTLRRE